MNNRKLIFYFHNTSFLWSLVNQIKNKYSILIALNKRSKIDKISFIINKLFSHDNNLKIKMFNNSHIFYMAIGYSPGIGGLTIDNVPPEALVILTAIGLSDVAL